MQTDKVIHIDGAVEVAKPKCAACIRALDGKITKRCPKHDRRYNGAVSLSADQLRDFLHAAQASSPRDYAMFLVMFLHGLRVTELTNLTLADVNFEQGEIRITPLKTGKYEPSLESFSKINGFDEREALLAYLAVRPQTEAGAPLFIPNAMHTKLRPLHRTYITMLYQELAAKIGLPARAQHIHTLRHTLGKRLYDAMRTAGHVDMPTIQRALRHKNPASTAVYASPDAEQVHASKHELLSNIL